MDQSLFLFMLAMLSLFGNDESSVLRFNFYVQVVGIAGSYLKTPEKSNTMVWSSVLLP